MSLSGCNYLRCQKSEKERMRIMLVTNMYMDRENEADFPGTADWRRLASLCL